ncbi:unnamed protein product [Protopolystoma xenopodis]|uniref:Uncharacterized protein n=1 Tax=Protopolystoma xenopodis TaxID=117903 RepID=A0A3S5B6C7_9PLAT|nr:unnamed protein product [Protopolystoma xenopodis]
MLVSPSCCSSPTNAASNFLSQTALVSSASTSQHHVCATTSASSTSGPGHHLAAQLPYSSSHMPTLSPAPSSALSNSAMSTQQQAELLCSTMSTTSVTPPASSSASLPTLSCSITSGPRLNCITGGRRDSPDHHQVIPSSSHLQPMSGGNLYSRQPLPIPAKADVNDWPSPTMPHSLSSISSSSSSGTTLPSMAISPLLCASSSLASPSGSHQQHSHQQDPPHHSQHHHHHHHHRHHHSQHHPTSHLHQNNQQYNSGESSLYLSIDSRENPVHSGHDHTHHNHHSHGHSHHLSPQSHLHIPPTSPHQSNHSSPLNNPQQPIYAPPPLNPNLSASHLHSNHHQVSPSLSPAQSLYQVSPSSPTSMPCSGVDRKSGFSTVSRHVIAGQSATTSPASTPTPALTLPSVVAAISCCRSPVNSMKHQSISSYPLHEAHLHNSLHYQPHSHHHLQKQLQQKEQQLSHQYLSRQTHPLQAPQQDGDRVGPPGHSFSPGSVSSSAVPQKFSAALSSTLSFPRSSTSFSTSSSPSSTSPCLSSSPAVLGIGNSHTSGSVAGSIITPSTDSCPSMPLCHRDDCLIGFQKPQLTHHSQLTDLPTATSQPLSATQATFAPPLPPRPLLPSASLSSADALPQQPGFPTETTMSTISALPVRPRSRPGPTDTGTRSAPPESHQSSPPLEVVLGTRRPGSAESLSTRVNGDYVSPATETRSHETECISGGYEASETSLISLKDRSLDTFTGELKSKDGIREDDGIHDDEYDDDEYEFKELEDIVRHPLNGDQQLHLLSMYNRLIFDPLYALHGA